MFEHAKPQFCRLCYGYTKSTDKQIVLDEYHSNNVKLIFQEYFNGSSLAAIAETLHQRNVLSPTGKDRWARAAIDNLLSNIKYVPHIISPQVFLQVQNEKIRRSNQELEEDDMQRKATRYHSLNGLSGLLVCAECGANYRRITRNSGEAVWRCANRVEHGKTVCHHSPTIPESEVIPLICKALGLVDFDPEVVHENLEQILVYADGTLDIQLKQQQNMSLTL